MKKALPLLAAVLAVISCTKEESPPPFGAIPSQYQIEWQKMETNMFLHFGPNTFTAKEWGDGTEAEDIFNPEQLDCNQWASIAKASGFKGMIITAKHHDGFCLWPNPESVHTVAQSSWRDGKGDVLRELSEACADNGVKFGVYVSPWDRNHPMYGTNAYNDVFVNTLKHIYSNYGEIFEQWFDGACGEGPNGKQQVYDWPRFNGTVEEMEPQAIIFSDAGPGCRWIGNERGFAGSTNWSTIDISSLYPGIPHVNEILNSGVKGALDWVPGETDVSIRPGWFWKRSETPQVKSLNQLLKIWYESVGRNSLLLLNVPPDDRGLIDPVDSARLMEFRAALDEIQSVNYAKGAKVKASVCRGRGFGGTGLTDGKADTYWAAPDEVKEASLEIRLASVCTFNRVALQEFIALGQRIEEFSIEVFTEGDWQTVAEGTTIGYKRIALIPVVTTDRLRINVKALACPTLSNLELYMDKIYQE